MSTGAIVFLVAILLFFVFEVGSFIATIVKKRKALKRGEVNENKSIKEEDTTDDRCTDNEVDN